MAAKTWDGGGLTNNWSEGANWSGDTVPVTTDVCTFDVTSTKACTIDALGTFVGTITVASTYGSTITQNVAIQLTGSCTLANRGSTWAMNANITGSASLALSDDGVAGGILTRTTGNITLSTVSVSDLSVFNMGTDMTVGGITTVSGSTITGDGDITFVTGTTNLANGTNWDTSGVTSLRCQGSGTAAHALTIGTTETALSGVPITVTGAGNFTFTGAPYDFNVVAVTKSGNGGITIAATADVDFGTDPTITVNGLTINGEAIIDGTLNYVGLSSAAPVVLSVGAGGIVSGTLSAINLNYGLTINAAATFPAGVVLNINPSINTDLAITATAHTFGTCTLTGGGSNPTFSIASGTSITMAANQTGGSTGTVTVTGTLNLLGDLTLGGAMTTAASSTLSGTGEITCTNGAFTMNATGTVANTIGVCMTFTSATGRTFAGAGKTYATLRRRGSGSGTLTITGTNTFLGAITDNEGLVAHTIVFPNVTTTVGGFYVKGVSGKLVTMTRTGGAGTWTLTTTGGVNIDQVNYISVSNSTVDAAPVWYAGANSTNGGGNTNWIFTAPPNINLFRQQAQIIF